ncbi:MAG: penicillin-binding transpeptidase domain-containing protein, partial [Patescibacteria group bacterium]
VPHTRRGSCGSIIFSNYLTCLLPMKLGKAFSDSLLVEKRTLRRFGRGEGDGPWWLGAGRALMFATAFFLAFFILFWRLFDLTVIRGREFRRLADGNRIRELTRHAPRGLLLDRTGKPLVGNLRQYRLLSPCQEKSEACVQYLAAAEAEQLEQEGLPAGAFLEIDYQRQYIARESLAHLLGYTGELSEKELQEGYYAKRNYRRGDRVGRAGAEAVFEERLRGRPGRQLVEVDAAGNFLRTLGQEAEVAGENITLAVDLGLAKAVARAVPAAARAAVVVAKPTTGEILALYSSPAFDPNKFTQGLSQAEYEAILDSPDRPLFDRSLGGVYPPGSTFKIVTALAGLTEGAINAQTTVEDVGVIRIGPFTFPNWYFTQYGKTDGLVDVVRALQRSNDIFFYKVGEWLGVSRLADWARRVGLGRPLGIELTGEAGGLVPDPVWKKQRFNTTQDRELRRDQWYLGDTYHVAIGQGYLLTTPLQVNTWTNVIANRGKLCKPTIKKVTSDKRQVISSCKDLGVKKETIELITEGMKRACEPGGTGWPLFEFGIRKLDQLGQLDKLVKIPVACKTGTAEFGDPAGRTHAWFTVFAPVPDSSAVSTGQAPREDETFKGSTLQGGDSNLPLFGEPEISVTVLVEGGGEGSNVAAPIAKKILEEWFSR